MRNELHQDYHNVSDLLNEVINELQLNPFSALGNDNQPSVLALAIDKLETPDLCRGPTVVNTLDMAQHVGLAVGSALLSVALEPVLGRQIRILNIRRSHPLGLAAHMAEKPVAVVAELEIEAPLLCGSLHATSACLFDFDVRHLRARRVRGRGWRGRVVLDVQSHRRQAHGLARNPADTLERQARLNAGGLALVLVPRHSVSLLLSAESKLAGTETARTHHHPFSAEVTNVLGLRGSHRVLCTFW